MASSIITNLEARTNGLSFVAQGKVRGKQKTYHMHLSQRYGNEIEEVDNGMFNIYQRPVDKQQTAMLREELISQMIGKRS